MTVYAPGTQERDPSKQNMALQQQAAKIATNTANVATNTANIATNTAAITALQSSELTAASKSDQQTGTSTTKAVTPAHQQDHDSALKVHVSFSVSAGVVTVLDSYNVSSVVRNSAGNYTVNFTVAFASTSYSVVASSEVSSASQGIVATISSGSRSVGSVVLLFLNLTSDTLADPLAAHVHVAGRQ